MSYSKCPSCQKSVGGMFGVAIVNQERTDLINQILGKSVEAYCFSCANDYAPELVKIQNKKYYGLQEQIVPLVGSIPILTSQAPMSWEYRVLDMVTSQTTSGTGFITDLSQSINDFFGLGSESTNRKVAEATEKCKTALRLQCVKLGGNAVIACDIDFSEIGSGNTNMLMVCMAGTAIKVYNPTHISTSREENLEKIELLVAQLGSVSELNKALNAEFKL